MSDQAQALTATEADYQTSLPLDAPRVGKAVTPAGGHCLACDRSIPDPPDGGFAPDPCIGFIPGAVSACCGHGDASRALVVLGGVPDRLSKEIDVPTVHLHGKAALAFFDLIRDASRGSTSIETARWLTDDGPYPGFPDDDTELGANNGHRAMARKCPEAEDGGSSR